MDAKRDPKSCLVTGATGVVGPQLVEALVDRGFKVRVLVRRCPPSNLFPPGVTTVEGDLLDRDALQKSTSGIDAVFHLAAKLHVNNPDAALRDEYQRVNVEGTRLLLDLAVAAGVRRFVYFSTISVYGPGESGQVFSEVDTPAPDGIYAQTKYEAERCVLGARRPETLAPIGVVLRIGAIYGPHMKGNYPRLIRAIRKGLFIPLGNGSNRRTLVHERDVVVAAMLAAEHPRAAGQVYNVTDGQIHTFGEIVATICQVLGKALPPFHLPTTPVRFLAGVAEDVFRFVGRRSLIVRATVDKLIEDVAVTGEKFQREMNFQPQFDLPEGWRDTIKQSRSEEWKHGKHLAEQ